MSNLLEKASILLTPTAYDDGKILSVKPEEVLGNELVVNGDFSDGTNDWSVANGTISVDNDRLKIDGNSGATAEQTVTAIIGKTYKVTYAFTLGTATSGALIITGGNYPTLNAPQGVNTFYTTATQTNLRIRPRLGSNGTMFIDNISVKEAIDGDFDFTRNSSATRVNSQGLIEDMQILSGNLVSNGDFSQEGAELITNGDFATDSDWTKDAGWTISNGTASCNGSGVNSLQQSGITTVGKIYKLTFDVLDSNNFNFLVISANFGDTYVDADLNNAVVLGKNTFYIKPTNGTGIRFRVSNGTTLSIDNVSVKEVGQDWTLGSFTNIGNNVANIVNSTGELSLQQNIGVSQKTIKLTYTISNYSSGGIRPQYGAVNGLNRSANGTYTEIITGVSASTNLAIFSVTANTTATITNISAVEITDDTNLPRINYEGFSYQDSLGSELVSNGDFSDGLNGWSAHVGSTLELENGMAKVTTVGSQGFIKRTDLSIETGKTYFCKAYITNGLSPQWYINSVNNPVNLSLISENTYGGYVTTTGNNSYFYIRGNGTSGEVSYIDNVSVKEVLGQEVVPDSGCGSWLFEPQSTNLVTYSEDFSQSGWVKTGNTTISATNIISPSGQNNATNITGLNGSGGNDLRFFPSGFNSANKTLSFSVYLKGSGTLRIQLSNGVDQSFPIIINLSSTWERYSLTSTFNSTNTQTEFHCNIDDSGGNATSYDVWGAQLEQLSYPTSYIPTNGSTVTRLKDAAFGSGNSDLINSTEGVLYFEGSALTNETDVNKTIGISNVSSSNRVQLTLHGTPSRISFYGTSSEGFALSYSNFSYNKTEPLKIAVKWKIGDVGIFINGIKVYTGTPANTFLSNTLNTLSFADYNNVGSPFYGKTKCLAVFKEALTDEELECLTTDETSYSSFTALALANNYTII